MFTKFIILLIFCNFAVSQDNASNIADKIDSTLDLVKKNVEKTDLKGSSKVNSAETSTKRLAEATDTKSKSSSNDDLKSSVKNPTGFSKLDSTVSKQKKIISSSFRTPIVPSSTKDAAPKVLAPIVDKNEKKSTEKESPVEENKKPKVTDEKPAPVKDKNNEKSTEKESPVEENKKPKVTDEKPELIEDINDKKSSENQIPVNDKNKQKHSVKGYRAEEPNKFKKINEIHDEEIPLIKNKSKKRITIRSDDDSSSSHFMVFMFLGLLFTIIGYIAFQKRKKIMAYVIEGRRRSSRDRRLSGSKDSKIPYKPIDSEDKEAGTKSDPRL